MSSREINSKTAAKSRNVGVNVSAGEKMQRKQVKGDGGSFGELCSGEKRNGEWLQNFLIQSFVDLTL